MHQRFHLVALVALVALAAAGCGSDDATTGDATTGKRIAVSVSVAADPGVADKFTLASGFDVTLTKAAIALSGVQFFDGAPATARAPAPRRRSTWDSWLIGTAHAHPGHYQAGNAVGEALVPGSFDLFGGTSQLGKGEGVTGVFRSGRVSLSGTPTGPGASALGGASVALEGTAVKGASTLHFRLVAPLSEVEKSLSAGRVEGVPFDERAVTGDVAITLRIKPSVWLSFVDFKDLTGGTADAPIVLGPESAEGVTFAVGVAQISAYRFSVDP